MRYEDQGFNEFKEVLKKRLLGILAEQSPVGYNTNASFELCKNIGTTEVIPEKPKAPITYGLMGKI